MMPAPNTETAIDVVNQTGMTGMVPPEKPTEEWEIDGEDDDEDDDDWNDEQYGNDDDWEGDELEPLREPEHLG